MRDLNFEKELKKAVHEVCLAMAAWNASLAVAYEFPASYKDRLCSMLVRSEKRIERKRTMLRAAACFAALVLAFSVICAASPKVWAAVRSWYVIHIGPDQTVYQFEQKENDHAFLVVRSDAMPDGMELININEGDGYSIQEYANVKTGEYINFSYHWLTVRERVRIEQMAEQFGTVQLANGYEAVLYEEDGLAKLVWYEKYNLISYWAESNLSGEELIAAFKEIEIHPPEYVPTWLPEGYELIDSEDGSRTLDYIYMNQESGDIIMITIADYGIMSQMSVLGEGEAKDVEINGNEGAVSWGGGLYEGTTLFFIDKKENLVFVIQTGLTDPDIVVQIAESLQKTGQR